MDTIKVRRYIVQCEVCGFVGKESSPCKAGDAVRQHSQYHGGEVDVIQYPVWEEAEVESYRDHYAI